MTSPPSKLNLLASSKEPQLPPNSNDLVEKCRLQAANLLTIFSDKSLKKEDVLELVQTVQRVEGQLAKMVKLRIYDALDPASLSRKIFMRTTEKLLSLLEEYFNLIAKMQKSNQLEKSLASINIRRQIEQMNSAVLVECNILDEKHEHILQEKGKKADRVPSQEKNVAKVIIEDPDGLAMWEKNLGASAFMAPWDKFIKSLSTSLGSITDDMKKALKHILDNSNTGFVSSYKFSEFLRGFGPFKNCQANVSKLMAEKWFHGFLSMEEARKFLEAQPDGTFLVRFSSSRPGSFAVAFVQNQKVTSVMIKTGPNGYSIQEQAEEKVFPTVQQLVAHYSSILVHPFDSTLPEEPWFYGDIDGNDAEKYLQGKKPGMYLIRFSSQPGYFAGSYVDRNGEVSKCLIASRPSFFIADMEGAQYGKYHSMKELVQEFGTLFKYPYKKSTNQVNNSVRKKIATEILDTERSYVKSLTTVSQIFIEPLKGKMLILKEEAKDIFANITDILEVHASFFVELERAIANFSDESLLGDEFLKLAPKLDCYKNYVNNYNTALTTLNKCMKKEAFKKFIEAALTRPESDQNSLTSYLIQPIQRIPRYILLVSDLLKHTESSHIDYDSLVAALDKIKQVADAINESKRKAEMEAKVVQIQSLMQGDFEKFAMPGRIFVREGDFTERTPKQVSERHAFLLSDMIVTCKKKAENKYHFKRQMILKGAKLIDVPDKKDEKNCFRIVTSNDELFLMALTPQDKESWSKDITQAINGLQLKVTSKVKRDSSSSFVYNYAWIPNSTPPPSAPTTPEPSRKPERAKSPELIKQTSSPNLAQKGHGSTRALNIQAVQENYEHIPIKTAPVSSPSLQSQHSHSNLPRAPAPPVAHVGEWKEAFTADGKKYYYNTVTRQTSWTKPVIESKPEDVDLALAETQLELEEIEWELSQSSIAYEKGLHS